MFKFVTFLAITIPTILASGLAVPEETLHSKPSTSSLIICAFTLAKNRSNVTFKIVAKSLLDPKIYAFINVHIQARNRSNVNFPGARRVFRIRPIERNILTVTPKECFFAQRQTVNELTVIPHHFVNI